MILTALAAFAVATSHPLPVQDPDLTVDQTISCAASMLALSKTETDPATVQAMENAIGLFLERARSGGLTEAQVNDRAAQEFVVLKRGVDALSDAQAKRTLIWAHGPGMDRCIASVVGGS